MCIRDRAITTPQKLAGAVKDVKSYPKYLVTTLTCVLLVQVSYLMTIDWTNSGTATVLQTLNLIFVLAWVCLRGKRLPLKRELVGVLLAFAGTFLIATGGNFASLSLPWQGLAWGLVDAVSTAAMSIQMCIRDRPARGPSMMTSKAGLAFDAALATGARAATGAGASTALRARRSLRR